MGWLPIVKMPGLTDAIRSATMLRNMLGSGWKVELALADRTLQILAIQITHGRDVVTLTSAEEQEIVALFHQHVEAARDSSGRISGGEAAGEELYTALGEFLRDQLARKINDEAPTEGGKAPLSEKYAAWKAARYGAQPILVATAEMLGDVAEAGISVTKGG